VKMKPVKMFSLEGKTVFLTGAAGFLGRTFAVALLESGARLVCTGRGERLLSLAETWKSTYGPESCRAIQVDMYNRDRFAVVLDEVAATEDVRVLVNNAHELGPATGFNTPAGALENMSFDQWMRNLTGGVFWAALTTQKLGEGMKRGGGSIINISTMYALVAPRPKLYERTNFLNPPGYSASKAALLGFTRYVASFWGAYGIRANAILPGPFSNTEDTGPNAVPREDEFVQRLCANTCLGRIGKPHELAGALLFLASDASTYVTGHALVVDGGWTAV
jgi:NAD(P)-dependent dehydrogenase (short-subunit alcohol dehydrogenase family)